MHIGRVEAQMQEVIAVFLALLLLFPAGRFGQESKANDGSTTSWGHWSALSSRSDVNPEFDRRAPIC